MTAGATGNPAAAKSHPGSARTLTDWLRTRTDAHLAALLQARPDLAVPPPPDLATLATRLSLRMSVQRAVDALDTYQLAVVHAVLLERDHPHTPVRADRLARWLVDVPASAGLEHLRAVGLAWGEDDGVRLVPTVEDAVGSYPAGLGRPAAVLFDIAAELPLVPVLRAHGLDGHNRLDARDLLAARLADPDAVRAMVDELDEDTRGALHRLAGGPPVGTNRTLDVSADSPGRRLLDAGLVAPIDTHTVELPREVGLAVRAHPLGLDGAAAPDIATVERSPDELDRLGATVVLDVLRRVGDLCQSWAQTPPAQLRAGGLGVRELRRTAREVDLPEDHTAVLIEVSAAAGLIGPTSGVDPVYLPTSDFDAWEELEPARQWTELASAWLAMSRQPSLVGERGERDRVIAALGPDAERGTIAALRAQVLATLAELPPGSAPATREAVLDRLAWDAPRRAGGLRSIADAVLAEADLLGLTAAGGLTGYTRTLRSGSPLVAEQVLAGALPQPVHEMVIQPDLTVVVPGPPAAELSARLHALADLESSGGANVFRISEASVRRAMDLGRSREELLDFLNRYSRTPVPQALQYMIDDAARRHGVLRAGGAASYLRSDDTDLLATVLADRIAEPLALRRLAPTVLVSSAPAGQVLRALREAGFAPAAEAVDGGIVELEHDSPRAPARPPVRPVVGRSRNTIPELTELARRMRAADAADLTARASAGRAGAAGPVVRRGELPPAVADVAGLTSATLMTTLRELIRSGQTVRLTVAGADGHTSEHAVVPISMAGGFVRGHELGRSGLVSFPIHRVQSVQVIAEAAED